MSYPPPPAYPPAPQSPPDAGPLRGRTPRRLGWIFLALAIILFVIGAIVVAKKSYSEVKTFQRVSIADGSGSVNVDRTGKWVIYYEASNVNSSFKRIPDITVLVTTSSKPVQLSTYGKRKDGKVDRLTYDYNGHKGAAAAEFQASDKGTYQVQVRANETLPSGADLAFGKDIKGGTVAGGALIVGGVVCLIVAIVLLIVGFVKRARHKSERQAAMSGYGQPAYGAPGGYPPPPPGYGPPQGYPQQPPPGGYQQPPAPGYQSPGQGQPAPGHGYQAPEQQQPGQQYSGQEQPGQQYPGYQPPAQPGSAHPPNQGSQPPAEGGEQPPQHG
jgi:hypothetical protein